MKTIRITVTLVVTWMFATAVAQDVSTYRIKVEDVISIRVFGEPDLAVDAPVNQDGTISYPFLGFIKVEGMTTVEVENFIRTSLINGGYYVDPKVNVNIQRFRPNRASVVGLVGRPGQFDFKPGDRILTLLAQAGGHLPNRSRLNRTTLIRRGSLEQIPIDLEAMLERGDLSQNYELLDGDVLNIPEDTTNRVNVMGAVVQPRVIEWRRGLTLADAISGSGGEIPFRSKLSSIQIQRPVPGRENEYFRIQVDFTKFVAKGDYSQNVELMPGDVVYVPPTDTPDLNRLNQIANVLFTIQSITTRNFSIFPRF